MEGGLSGAHEVGPTHHNEVEKASSGASDFLGTTVSEIAGWLQVSEDQGVQVLHGVALPDEGVGDSVA